MVWSDLKDEFRAAFAAGTRAADDLDTEASFDLWWTRQRDLTPVWELHLPVRVLNALARHDIRTIAQLRPWLDFTTEPNLYDIRNLGFKSVEATVAALEVWDREGSR